MNRIEIDDQTLQLISRALDLYSRMGMGQFWYLTDNNTIQNNLWGNDEKSMEFERKAVDLSNVYTGITGKGCHGIFHKSVGEDCKQAAHLHQVFRHEFWKRQKPSERSNATVDASPADICQIANVPVPYVKISEFLGDKEFKPKDKVIDIMENRMCEFGNYTSKGALCYEQGEFGNVNKCFTTSLASIRHATKEEISMNIVKGMKLFVFENKYDHTTMNIVESDMQKAFEELKDKVSQEKVKEYQLIGAQG